MGDRQEHQQRSVALKLRLTLGGSSSASFWCGSLYPVQVAIPQFHSQGLASSRGLVLVSQPPFTGGEGGSYVSVHIHLGTDQI